MVNVGLLVLFHGRAAELLARHPSIEKVDVLAAKLLK
jgi:hypothetical protein